MSKNFTFKDNKVYWKDSFRKEDRLVKGVSPENFEETNTKSLDL